MNQRIEAVKRWANYIKNNPDRWKNIHTEFIDSQFIKQREFMERLIKNKPDGKKRLIKAYKIKNIKGYPSLQKKD